MPDIETLTKFAALLMSGSPIAILGTIGYGVYLIWKLSVNHLHHIEKSMERIATSSERQEATLGDIKTGIEVLKDRSPRK